MDKKFVIFDLDGTLVDSMGVWTNLFTEFLGARGITSIPEGMENDIKTMTLIQSSAYCVERLSLKETPEDIIAELKGIMVNHYKNDIELKCGVRSLLSELKENGVKMCVASATAKPLVYTCLKRLEVLDYFEFLLSCEEVGVGKDSPDVYLEVAKRLGAKPHDIAVYEDALNAVETASNAGFYTVAVFDKASQGQWKTLSSLADETVIFE